MMMRLVMCSNLVINGPSLRSNNKDKQQFNNSFCRSNTHLSTSTNKNCYRSSQLMRDFRSQLPGLKLKWEKLEACRYENYKIKL